MNAFAEFLKHHVKENPQNYGSDALSILEIPNSCKEHIPQERNP